METQTHIIGIMHEMAERVPGRSDYDCVFGDEDLGRAALEILKDADLHTEKREAVMGTFVLSMYSPDDWQVFNHLPLSLRLPD